MTTESELAIRLEDVSRSFRVLLSLRDFARRRVVQAVDHLSLDIPRGQVFGLLGPNGSGKTTTIAMLLGLLRPDAGRIEILGARPGDHSVRRRIGYLPEEFSPPEYLTGYEILRFYGGLFGIPRAALARRIDEYLELLDLSAARHRKFREYSKGMRRRIGLAQALLHDPELIVLDEPSNGLDPIGVRKVKSLICDLKARGRTLLIASHILPEMEEICDRIAILHEGRCICSGSTEELLHSAAVYEILVDGADLDTVRKAARVLGERGLNVREVRPASRSLESLFLEQLGEEDPRSVSEPESESDDY